MTAAQELFEPQCDYCHAKPATCFGKYENALVGAYACDDCCGHGCEDGHCDQLKEEP